MRGVPCGELDKCTRLLLFQAGGIMFWEEAMEKRLASQHLEDTAGEIN